MYAAEPTTTGVPDYLWWAIVGTVFCWPVGLVAIYFAVKAKRRAVTDDLDGALRASHIAKTLCWVSFVVGAVLLLNLVATGGFKV